MRSFPPRRIVCLTEETTETLYLLGEGDRVVGVSGYTVRPPEARQKPRVSSFLHARYEKIEALEPDLILAFSDLQAEITTELVKRGHTVFTFNQGGFDGPLKRYNPRGFVRDPVHKSTWGMRFVWPFKAEFLVTHVNADYSQTVVGRTKRDYVWIMARTPEIPAADYDRLVRELAAQGYDVTKLRKVPQRWPAPPPG